MTRAEIADVLKTIRTKAGLTQKQAAEAIGRKQQTLASWETGQSQPDADTLFALCELYGTSVDDAFGFSRPDSLEWGREILNRFRALSPDAQLAICKILDLEHVQPPTNG